MSQGTLTRNGSPLLFDLSLVTGALAPGQRFRLDASARTAAGRRLTGMFATTPSAVRDGVIDLDSLQVGIAEQHGAALQLEGRGSWRGGEDLALQLAGSLLHRSFAPPPPASGATRAKAGAGAVSSAPPTTDDNVIDKIELQIAPARAGVPLTVTLKLDGDDAHADLRMQPTQFDDWWTRLLAAQPGEPSGHLPFTGTAQAKQLDLGWLKATDISIDAGTDLAPAPGTSTGPAPASATSGGH